MAIRKKIVPMLPQQDDKKKGRANSVDEHVGLRLRQRRTLMGISQEKLAESVGVTFQQIQKYENGANRISASRLFHFSQILDVPVTFFFDTFGGIKLGRQAHGLTDNDQDAFSSQADDLMQQKETIDLIRVYYSIKNPKVRKDLFKLVKTMAENMNEEDGE